MSRRDLQAEVWREALGRAAAAGLLPAEAVAPVDECLQRRGPGPIALIEVAWLLGMDGDEVEGLFGPLLEIDPTVGRSTSTGVGASREGTTRPAAPPLDATHVTDPPWRLGPYERIALLGRGGMGSVYRVRDTRLDRVVALKRIDVDPEDIASSASAIERFRREATALARLGKHPHLVQVHDFGQEGNAVYFTMDLVEGTTLREWMRAAVRSPREVASMMHRVCLGLAHAHACGIVHRDVKPANILVDASGEPQVSDFGLVRDLGETETLTRTGQVVGTLAYMAPEQAAGDVSRVGLWSDVYSLGVVLYEALCGTLPIEAAVPARQLVAIQTSDPVPPSRRDRRIPAELDAIAMRCLEKEPERRYRDASSLGEDLRRWLAGEPIEARRAGPALRLWKRMKRHKAVTALVTALAAVVAGSLLWLSVRVVMHARQVASLRVELDRDLAASSLDAAEGAARELRRLEPRDPDVERLYNRVKSEQAVKRGDEALTEYAEKRDRLARMRERLRQVEEAAAETSAPAERRPIWALSEEVASADRDRQRLFALAVAAYSEAIGYRRDNSTGAERLGELYWDRYVEAEEARDLVSQAAYERLGMEFAPATFADRLQGRKRVHVEFRLPEGFAGEAVEAYLFVYRRNASPPVSVPTPWDVGRGIVAGDPSIAGTDPLPSASATPEAVSEARLRSAYALACSDANRLRLPVTIGPAGPRAGLACSLPRGSYLLCVSPDARLLGARYPFEVGRQAEWDEAADLSGRGDEPPATIEGGRPDWVYIPAGPYRAGGDLGAYQTVSRAPVRLRVPPSGGEGFFLARFEVTCAEYLAYLNDRGWHAVARAIRRVPRGSSEWTPRDPAWRADASGTIAIVERGFWREDVPVACITYDDTIDYCAWLTKTRGRGEWEYALPSEDEWEKAARGVDGRYFPWGDEFDTSFCHMNLSRRGETAFPGLEPVGCFPVDESPFGVRDMAGGVAEWTRTRADSKSGWPVLKGGSWELPGPGCRSACRNFQNLSQLSYSFGLRVSARRRRR